MCACELREHISAGALFDMLCQIFSGNSDSNTVVTNYFAANIYGVRFVRIYAQSWTNGIAVRFDILGCNARESALSVDLVITIHEFTDWFCC